MAGVGSALSADDQLRLRCARAAAKPRGGTICEQTLGNVEVGSIKLVTARVKAPKGDPGMTLMQRTYLEALQVHSGEAIHLGQCRRDRGWMESHPCEAHEVGAPAFVETLVKDIALVKEQAG